MDAGFSHMVDGAMKSWRQRGSKGIPPIITGQLMAIVVLVMGVVLLSFLKRIGYLESANITTVPDLPLGWFIVGVAFLELLGAAFLVWAWKYIRRC